MTILLTIAAMLAFAGNSVICRLALENGAIDAASFSSIRIIAGVAVLYLAGVFGRTNTAVTNDVGWVAPLALFAYFALFGFSYLVLGAGLGALILFCCVHLTMLVAGLYHGERYVAGQWLGVGLALFGLVYLVAPDRATDRQLWAGLLMAGAGIAWGIYSLRGRGNTNPLATTRANFLRILPLALLLPVISPSDLHLTTSGIALAVFGGAVTTGLGYAVWYRALSGLTATEAGLYQLAVPVLAVVGGVVFIAEPVTVRMLQASAMILGGIACVVILDRRRLRALAVAADGPSRL